MPPTHLYRHPLLNLLGPFCDRLLVVGSLRRGIASAHNLDLLAIPTVETHTAPAGLFGPGGEALPTAEVAVNKLWQFLDALVVSRAGPLYRHPRIELTNGKTQRAAWGDKHRKLLWRPAGGDAVSVSLYTATAASWGAQCLIRTGPKGFSRWWVNTLKTHGYVMSEGEVWKDGRRVETCSEADALRLVGQRYLEPHERRPPLKNWGRR